MAEGRLQPIATGSRPCWWWGHRSCHTNVARGQPGAQSSSTASKAGRANQSKQLDKQKIYHSKASFDPFLAHVQSCLYRKIPRDSSALAASSELPVSRFSLCRVQTLSSARHTCSLKMSRSNYRPLKHGIHKDSSARPLSLMLWIVSSLTVCEGCSEDYKFWEQFQFKEYSNQISKPRLCLYHSLVPSLNHYACMRLRFLKSSPVKWQVKKKKKSRSSNTPKMWEKALYFRHLCSYTTLFFFSA